MLYQDIPRLYTAIAEWVGTMTVCALIIGIPRTIKFWESSILFLIFQSVFLIVTDSVPIALWIPCMFLAVLGMLLFIRMSCQVSIITAGYFCASAFMIAEFIASFNWQITYFILHSFDSNGNYNILDDSWFEIIISVSLLLIIYTSVSVFTVWLMGRQDNSSISDRISWQEFLAAGMTVTLVFTFSNLSFILPNSPFSGRVAFDIFNVRTIIDLAGLAILYAHQAHIQQLHAEAELAQMDAVLKSQYEQYRHYQDGIEMINIKYHDLKHQLTGLRAEMDPDKRTEWIDRMTEEVRYYRPERETGNPVLNTLISGKTPAMRNMQIQFTCVADGQLLNFMHVTDICSIFGNALDNAIENVALISNPDKRLIHLQVHERQGFLFIMMTNCCETKVEFRDGMPVTTKMDSKNHGYGVKSIKRTAEKYGGNVTWNQNGDEFDMKVLIPMPG